MSDIDHIDTSNARDNAKYRPLTPEQRAKKQERFLKAYRETANIKHACKVAGISRQTYLNWKATDEVFKAQLPDADEEANDTLELAAYDRAVKGVPSFVVSQGRMVYEETPVFDEETGEQKLDKKGRRVFLLGKPLIERKYSDALLITLLKARMPEKYKDRTTQEHTGKDGGPINVNGQVGYYPVELPRKGTPKKDVEGGDAHADSDS
jgi:hypothetical protein